MNESINVWAFMIFLVIYRKVIQFPANRRFIDGCERRIFYEVRRFLERMSGPSDKQAPVDKFSTSGSSARKLLKKVDDVGATGSPIVEWYFLLLLFLTYMMLKSLYNFWKYDFLAYHKLADPSIQVHLTTIAKNNNGTYLSDKQVEDLSMKPWMRAVVMVAPFIGSIAYAYLVSHVITYTQGCKVQKERLKDNLKMLKSGLGDEDTIDLPGVVDSDAQVIDKGHARNGQTGRIISYDRVGGGVQFQLEFEQPQKLQDETVAPHSWYEWLLSLGKKTDKLVVAETDKFDYLHLHQLEIKVESANPWRVDVHEDLGLLVIMMPGIFILMAMRAQSRQLQAMGLWPDCYNDASCNKGKGADIVQVYPRKFDDFKQVMMFMYVNDLDCASAFQYITVAAFAALCMYHFSIQHLTKRAQSYVKSADENLKEIWAELQTASADHVWALSVAGLLGVWAYIVVGVMRCCLGIGFTVVVTFMGNEAAAPIQEFSDKYLQPIFLFATVLCIINMIILSKMKDIRHESAFGPQVSMKFLAARGLLLVGDGQLKAMNTLTKLTNGVFSEHHGRLIHASLLMAECLFVVLFNMYYWRQSLKGGIKHRSKSAMLSSDEEAARGTFSGFKSVVQKRLHLKDRSALHVIFAPLLLVLITMVAASSQNVKPNCESKGKSNLGMIWEKPIDVAVVYAGPLLSLIPMLIRRWDIYRMAVERKALQQLESGWTQCWFRFWVTFFFVRLAGYLFAEPLHCWFSDHIFLVFCIIGMVCLEMVVLHHAVFDERIEEGKKRSIGALVVAWLIILAMLVEIFNTVAYYHTLQASWTAVGIGLVFFIGALYYLILFLENRPAGGLEEPLVDNSRPDEDIPLPADQFEQGAPYTLPSSSPSVQEEAAALAPAPVLRETQADVSEDRPMPPVGNGTDEFQSFNSA